MKKILAVLCALLLVSLCACSKDNSSTTKEPNKETTKTEKVVKEGSAKGLHGDVKVSVTLEGDKIVEVKVGENQETKELAEPAFKTIIEEVIKKNSAEVDTVTGATVSSQALIAAIKNALSK